MTAQTIRAKLEGMLDERCMLPTDIKQIIDGWLTTEPGKPMAGRMNDQVTGYPPALMPVCWMSLSHYTVEWIDQNCPQHWARPMFAEETARVPRTEVQRRFDAIAEELAEERVVDHSELRLRLGRDLTPDDLRPRK